MEPARPQNDQTRPRVADVAELTDDIGIRFRWERLCELDRPLAEAFAFNVEFRLSQLLDGAERRAECEQERLDEMAALRLGRRL